MDIFTILSGICFAIGSVAIVIGAWGLITLKDVYSRIHAAGMIDTAGVGFFVLGMIFLSGWSLVTVKLALIGIFLIFTSPISGHAVAQVAHSTGNAAQGRNLVKKGKAKSKKTNGGRS